MTDEQKAAMKWLDYHANNCSGGTWDGISIVEILRTLKAILAEPRLPKEREELVAPMLTAWRSAGGYTDVAKMCVAVDALYAHLTAPKPKTFRLWYGNVGHGDVPQERALEMVANAMAQGKPITIEPEAT